MITIEKAVAGDFEKIYPLLCSLGSARNSKEDWKRLFVNRWNAAEDLCGYVLLKDGEVKGFLGLILSTRLFNNRVEKFCNMTSWVVSEECRGHSLAMLLKVLKLKDYTITNFTPSKTVMTISNKMGFTQIETHQHLLLPIPRLKIGTTTLSRCDIGEQAIRTKLDDHDLKILNDHLDVGCEHLLVSTGDEYCYLVIKKIVRRRMPLAKIHYISRPDLFIALIDSVRIKICLKLRVMGLIIDERYLEGHRLKYARRYPQYYMAVIKPNSLEKRDIDTLYSELILLK